MDEIKLTQMNPENWTECQLMVNYFNDNPQESMKLMMYHNLMIQMYDGRN